MAVFRSPAEVEVAVGKLRESGFDMKHVSVGCRSEVAPEELMGFYYEGGQMHYWGKSKACWEALWKELPGWGYFAIPGIGPILIGGPLALWMVTVLENAAIFGGLSALGAALHTVGVSRSGISEYEMALKSGQCLVLVYGSSREVSRGSQVLTAVRDLEAKNASASR